MFGSVFLYCIFLNHWIMTPEIRVQPASKTFLGRTVMTAASRDCKFFYFISGQCDALQMFPNNILSFSEAITGLV